VENSSGSLTRKGTGWWKFFGKTEAVLHNRGFNSLAASRSRTRKSLASTALHPPKSHDFGYPARSAGVPACRGLIHRASRQGRPPLRRRGRPFDGICVAAHPRPATLGVVPLPIEPTLLPHLLPRPPPPPSVQAYSLPRRLPPPPHRPPRRNSPTHRQPAGAKPQLEPAARQGIRRRRSRQSAAVKEMLFRRADVINADVGLGCG